MRGAFSVILHGGIKEELVGLSVGEAVGFALKVGDLGSSHLIKSHSAQISCKELVSRLCVDHGRVIAAVFQDPLQ